MAKSPVKNRPIKFYNTMVKDSHQPGAVLRSKWLDLKDRLYPIVDIETETLSNTFEPVSLVPTPDKLYALGEDSTHAVGVYEVQTGGTFQETYVGGKATGAIIEDGTFYNNGTDELIYIITAGGDIDTFNTSTNAYTTGVYLGSASYEQMITVHPSYDDLFFVTDRKVYRVSKGVYDGKVFDLPANDVIYNMFAFRDKLVFITETPQGEIMASAWDCDSTNTAFSWSTKIGKGRPIIAGVADGQIICVTQRGLTQNKKENQGVIKVNVFNGGSFRERNSITMTATSFSSVVYGIGFSDGDYLYAGLSNQAGPAINPAGIYRFAPDGEVVCLATHPDIDDGFYTAIQIDDVSDVMTIAYRNDSSVYELGQIYDGDASTYPSFAEASQYKSGFLEDGYTDKAFKEFYISFEKLHAGEEEGHFYCRTSDEDSWAEIGKVDYDVEGEIDRIHFKRMLDGTPLPDFKKIQFKITSQYGLNITSAGYKFIYKDDHE